MKLIDLDAHFIKWEGRPPTQEQHQRQPDIFPLDGIVDWFIETEKLTEAHGICFLCPKSVAEKKDHYIQVYFKGSPVPPHLGQNKDKKTVRWISSGSSYDDLTLHPSIDEQSECGWHGWVKNGDAS